MVYSGKYRDTHVLICILSTIWSSVLHICKRKFMKKRKKYIINLVITLFAVSGIISITELCNQYNYYTRFIEFISFTCGFSILIISLYYYGAKLIISTNSQIVSEISLNNTNPVSELVKLDEKINKQSNKDIIVNVETNSSSII